MARGGYPGMGGNMNNMMKQMQKMQKKMEEVQAEIDAKELEATAGGGAVKGKREVLNIEIDQSVVDPEDVEMLQDLVLAAVNEGLRKAEQYAADEMKKVTGGINIPGLF
jgi:hypothetical protein